MASSISQPSSLQLLSVCREALNDSEFGDLIGHWIAGRTHKHTCGRHRHGYPWTAFPRSRCAGLAGLRKDDAYRRAERGQAKRTDVRLHRAVQVRSLSFSPSLSQGGEGGAQEGLRPRP